MQDRGDDTTVAEQVDTQVVRQHSFGFLVQRYPAVFALLIASLGFEFVVHISQIEVLYSVAYIFLFLILLCVRYAPKTVTSRIVWIALWFSAGAVTAYRANSLLLQSSNGAVVKTQALIEGTVSQIYTRDTSHIRFVVDGTVDGVTTEQHSASVIASVYKRSARDSMFIQHLLVGDKIVFSARIQTASRAVFPSDFNEPLFFAGEGIAWKAFVMQTPSMVGKSDKVIHRLQRIIDAARESLFLATDSLYSDDSKGFVRALLFGDKQLIAQNTRIDFARTGTSHILAVSGLHIAILGVGVYVLLGFIPRKGLKFFLFVLCISVFVLLSGMQASAVRAGIMAMMIAYCMWFERPYSLLNILCASTILYVLFQPSVVYSIGFQLSFASVLGIALFYNGFTRLFMFSRTWIVRMLVQSFALSASTSIAVSPLVAYYFGVYSLSAPIVNIIVVPLSSLAMVEAVLSLLSYAVLHSAGEFFARGTELLLNLTRAIVELFAHNSWAVVESSVVPLSIAVALLLLYIYFARSLHFALFRIVVAIVVLAILTPRLSQTWLQEYRYQDQTIFVEKLRPTLTVLTIDTLKTYKATANRALVQYLAQSGGDTLVFSSSARVAKTLGKQILNVDSTKVIFRRTYKR